MTIAFTCPGCASEYEVPDDNAGAVADCPECGNELIVPQPAPEKTTAEPAVTTTPEPALVPATPAPPPEPAPAAKAPAPAVTPSGPLYDDSPSMFRNRALLFIILCILCLGLVGIPFMLAWWVRCKGTRLMVDEKKTVLRTGILSKHETEVWHRDVRKVTVSQGILQRMFGVGTIRIGSAGTAGVEIEVHGLPKPAKIRDLINERRG